PANPVDREVPLVDRCDRRHAAALGERNQRSIRVVAGKARVLRDDSCKSRIVGDRLYLDQAGSARALEPDQSSALVRRTRGKHISRFGDNGLGGQQLAPKTLEPSSRGHMVPVGTVHEGDDRSGINKCAGHETPCAQARGHYWIAAPWLPCAG